MNISNSQKASLVEEFIKIQSKEDLVNILNSAKHILYPPKQDDTPKPIRLKSISFYADYRLSSEKRYRHFIVKKKNGSERKIAAPTSGLKLIQRCLNLIFGAVYEPKSYVTGFVIGKSIVDNANIHKGRRYIYNIDLKDFFPTITLYRVKAVLGLEPFNLRSEREHLAFLIANLCCIENPENKATLPQGAPTSPILSNLVCQKLDRRLSGLAHKSGCKYSRYADDITFSSDVNVFNTSFNQEMRRIIKSQGFDVNEKKVRLHSSAYRQEVTGLTVNEKVNVSKRYVRSLRAMLNNWEKLGYEKAEEVFLAHYELDKGGTLKGKPSLKNVLWGKLQFLKMVKGVDDAVYMSYQQKFNALAGLSESDSLAKLEKLLSIWEMEGIDKASQNGKNRDKTT